MVSRLQARPVIFLICFFNLFGKHVKFPPNSQKVKVSWLKEVFCDIDPIANTDRYIRAYILYLLGSVVLPGLAGDISLVFLPLLENLHEIKSYAWGAAALAHLHCCLKTSHKNERKTNVGGFTYALQVGISILC